MNTNELFTMALGAGERWSVSQSRFEGEPRKLELQLEPVGGLKWACPECAAASPLHDTVEKRWRHLNFFQYECELSARVPRCRCAEHGVPQVGVPWARPGSGFTLLFEALAMLLLQGICFRARRAGNGQNGDGRRGVMGSLRQAKHRQRGNQKHM